MSGDSIAPNQPKACSEDLARKGGPSAERYIATRINGDLAPTLAFQLDQLQNPGLSKEQLKWAKERERKRRRKHKSNRKKRTLDDNVDDDSEAST